MTTPGNDEATALRLLEAHGEMPFTSFWHLMGGHITKSRMDEIVSALGDKVEVFPRGYSGPGRPQKWIRLR